MDNQNMKMLANLSEIYNNIDMPKNVRKYARLTAIALINSEFPVAVNKKLTLTRREVHIGQTEGKLPCVRAYIKRTGLASLLDAKINVENHFSNNGLTFYQK